MLFYTQTTSKLGPSFGVVWVYLARMFSFDLSNNKYHIDLRADYGFQVFFDQNMFRSAPAFAVGKGIVPNGNLRFLVFEEIVFSRAWNPA